MRVFMRCCAIVALLSCLASFALQQPIASPQKRGQSLPSAATEDESAALPPSAKSHDAILRTEYAQNIKDASALIDLAQQLKLDLEKNDRYVVSMATIKKTDDIEKLAKRIRSRLRH